MSGKFVNLKKNYFNSKQILYLSLSMNFQNILTKLQEGEKFL